MTRDEALERIAKPAYDDEHHRAGLRVHRHQARHQRATSCSAIMAGPNKTYRDYKSTRCRLIELGTQRAACASACSGRSSDDHDRRLRPRQHLGVPQHVQAAEHRGRGGHAAPTNWRTPTKIILPGVGAFDHAMELLDASGMREHARRAGARSARCRCSASASACRSSPRPATRASCRAWAGSTAASSASSRCRGSDLPLPHMGWNDVTPGAAQRAVRRTRERRPLLLPAFVLLRVRARRRTSPRCRSYGVDFSCAVHAGNIYGVQFHPEKSHHFGAQLLKNFAEL